MSGLLLASNILPAQAQLIEKKIDLPAKAADQALKAVLTQFKVVKVPGGGERLEDASRVRPGDILEYRATYTNVSAKAVTGLVAQLPIPEGLVYQAHSAKPAADLMQAATADGRFAVEPLLRTVAGKTTPVPYVEYRQLRWRLGLLPAGGVTAVTARAQVEEVVPNPVKSVTSALSNPLSTHMAAAMPDE